MLVPSMNLEKYERSMELHTAWPVTLQARFLASTYGSLIVKKKYTKTLVARTQNLARVI